jgi:hypothetical protein
VRCMPCISLFRCMCRRNYMFHLLDGRASTRQTPLAHCKLIARPDAEYCCFLSDQRRAFAAVVEESQERRRQLLETRWDRNL